LLADPMCESYDDRAWPEAQRDFHRAYAPVSRFTLVLSAERPVEVAITARRGRWFTPRGSARLAINEREVGSFELRYRRTTIQHTIEAAHFVRGPNRIELVWPSGAWDGDRGIEEAAREMEAGRIAEFMPAFAEVSALACRAVRGPR